MVLLIEQIIGHHLKEIRHEIMRFHYRPILEQVQVDPWLLALIDPLSLRPRAEHHIVGQMVVPASQRRILLLYPDCLWKRHPRLVALNGMNGLVKPAVTDLSMGWPV